MWSDPIDEVIVQFGRLLDVVPGYTLSAADRIILKRVHRNAEEHRRRENKTGKVGFEATL